MITAFDISTSALVAQRARLDAISSNIANIDSIKNEAGENKPYQPRHVILQTSDELTTSGAAAVEVARVQISSKPPVPRPQPGHPLADADGNVHYPDINLTEEFVDALGATRAYEANVGVMEISRNLGRQTLRILG